MIFENSYIDFDKTAQSGQCFRWVRSKTTPDAWTVPVCNYTADIRRKDKEHIEVISEYDDEKFWRSYLDADRNYDTIFDHLYDNAPDHLRTAYTASYGISILNQPFFETCISFLISQNNNIPRIKSIIENICGGNESPFPDASTLEDILSSRDLRLGYRQGYLEKFCSDWQQGKLSDLAIYSPLAACDGDDAAPNIRRSDTITDRILVELQQFTGIGPKVAACIALFSLGCIDCVPRDVWIKRAEEEYDIVWDKRYAGYQQQLIFFWQQNKPV